VANSNKWNIFVKIADYHWALTSKKKKYLNLFIKLGITGAAFWFIYKKVNDQTSLQQFQKLTDSMDPYIMKWVLFSVLMLMFVNWFLEVGKWFYLVKKLERISFWKATQSVFAGLTWAVFTPNRIGEYGGRIMLLKPGNRAKGAVSMGVGQFAQLVLTSVAGALSIAWFVSTYLETPESVQFGVWLIAILYAGAFLVIYYNVHWIDKFVSKFKFLKKIQSSFSVLQGFSNRELSWVLFISLSRFLIFTSQYLILMLVILPELPFLPMLFMIFILFFIQSALPSLDLFDFSVRSFVASNLYSYITNQEIAVMAIVSCIWFVNIILPAILGSFFVLRTNYLGEGNAA